MIAQTLVFVSMLAAGAAVAADSSLLAPDQRKAAPSFTLNDSAVKTLRLSDYKGKIVLVNFWATSFPPDTRG